MLTRIRPYGCLKLGSLEAAWAEWPRNWYGQRHERCRVQGLPADVIKPTPIEPNVVDASTLLLHVQKIVRPPKKISGAAFSLGKPIVLVLPDLAVRAVILRLDSLPARKEDQTSLIRWRLGQEQLFPLGGTKVVFHLLDSGESSPRGAVTVLAVAIRESVLAQYEDVCEQMGLNPVEVDIATFRLFNLWAHVTRWEKVSRSEDLLWVSLMDEGFTVLIHHAGRLIFLRSKLLHARKGQEVSDPHASPDQRQYQERVLEEVLASLTVCMESHPEVSVNRVILANERTDQGLVELLGRELHVPVETIESKSLVQGRWSEIPQGDPLGGLVAVAGLLGR